MRSIPRSPPALLALFLGWTAYAAAGDAAPAGGRSAGLATIRRAEVERTLRLLADPKLEGRDSPGASAERAARLVAERFAAAGLVPAGGDAAGAGESGPPPEAFLVPFAMPSEAPVPEECRLEGPADAGVFRYGEDFVPIAGCAGEAEGELVFVGYGIRAPKERYDDFRGVELEGRIAVVLEGEPRHRSRFDGEELTRFASLAAKLADLEEEGAAGVLVVRTSGAAEGEGSTLYFRPPFAGFVGERAVQPPRRHPPCLAIDCDAATRLLAQDVRALAARIDSRVRPVRVDLEGRRARFRARTERREVTAHNVVGRLPGSDPKIAGEVLVIGAHYDHIGVDARGRIALGADDNGSGTAALCELAEALATARPRRTVLFVAFAAEEDGLIGSRAFVRDPPCPADRIVAMLNMDMIGRGEADEVAVLGVRRNPDLEEVLERARRASGRVVRKVVTKQGEELWRRSDHFPFHEAGIPSLFFFEGLPLSRNPDYHTWRDRPERVDCEKVTRTTKLVFHTAWILAEDDERPSPPRD